MKKNSFLLIFGSLIVINTSIYSQEIKSVVKIKPQINYDENFKYEKVEEYKEPEEKEYKQKYDFGFDMNINKEERTIDYWKIDIKTNF